MSAARKFPLPFGTHTHECSCCRKPLGIVCADFACTQPGRRPDVAGDFMPLCYPCWAGLVGDSWRELLDKCPHFGERDGVLL